MLEVIEATYLEEYKISLKFNNGTTGIADLKNELWGEAFEELQDINQFKKFTVSKTFHTLVWENEADLAPEFLYELLGGEKADYSKWRQDLFKDQSINKIAEDAKKYSKDF